MFDERVIEWLLEDNNLAVKYRTQTELLDMTADIEPVKSWLLNFLPKDWNETRGLWYRYYITAAAEAGLSKSDIPVDCFSNAFYELDKDFECGCGDFMLLTALLKLGFSGHETIQKIINKLHTLYLPDGGYLCLHRVKKLKYTPKSCYKANLQALLFLSECHKNNIDISFGQPLIDYFLNRNVFYRSTDKATLVINGREGWRTIDTFYPFEVMRVGIQNVVEAFSSLGYGNDERLREAWDILNSCKDNGGKMLLNGTLQKSYLPKEKINNPSKWVTFYTLLAEKEREYAEK